MQHFSQSATRRSIAWVVLAAWLFALTSGVVNACLLQERATHQHGDEGPTPGAHAALSVSAGHAGAVMDHSGTGKPGNAPCLKTCDQVSYSPVSQPPTPDAGDAGPASVHPLAWTLPPPALPALDGRTQRHRGSLALPIRTRYVRLAL